MSINPSISPQEIGRRVSEARRSRNLSQEDVARALGVSRPIVVSIEKGTRSLKPNEIIKLSQVLHRSVHDLVSKGTFVEGFMPQFRMTNSAEVSEEVLTKAVKDFQDVCENYLTLERILDDPLPYNYPEVYSVDRLSAAAAAEYVAQQERARLNLGQGPLPNLLDVLENDVGLRVFVLPLAEFRIAGMFYYSEPLGGAILVNGQHPYTRQRWSFAHEFAHFLANRYKEDVTIFIEYTRKPKGEQFADNFAASFLMPAIGLKNRFRRIVQTRGDFRVADLCMLADQYVVSVEAMTRRLEDLECVKRGMWNQLSQQVTLSKVREHLGLTSQNSEGLRLPERYTRLAVEAFDVDKIGENELMRFLRCSRVEARETVKRLTQSEEVATSGEPYQLSLMFADNVPIDATERI